MTTTTLFTSLASLFSELTDGPPAEAAFMLNGGDRGLLRSLDDIGAPAASAVPPAGGAPIAAHVDHLAYGLSLLNRWSGGDPDPWTGADWTAGWRRTAVNDAEWKALRESLRGEVRHWLAALQKPRELSAIELNGVIASIGHLAYHLGAIRQIDRALQGPKA